MCRGGGELGGGAAGRRDGGGVRGLLVGGGARARVRPPPLHRGRASAPAAGRSERCRCSLRATALPCSLISSSNCTQLPRHANAPHGAQRAPSG